MVSIKIRIKNVINHKIKTILIIKIKIKSDINHKIRKKNRLIIKL